MLTIDEIKKAAEKYGQKYGVERIYLFEFHPRDKNPLDDKISLRIDPGEIEFYYQLCCFKQDMEKELGTSLNVITTDTLSPKLLDKYKQDEYLLYERI